MSLEKEKCQPFSLDGWHFSLLTSSKTLALLKEAG
jgi:hypothetical protein